MKHADIINKIINGEILSEYNHANIITRINSRDFLQFDCSGFVAWYIGSNGYLRALAEIKNYLRQTDLLKINRFYCQDFERFFKDSKNFKYWEINKNTFEVSPNDILVIVYSDENGHMMIIDKILNKTDNLLELRIADSTRLLHKNDTRAIGSSGIGYGDIKLIIDGKSILYDPQNPTRTPTPVNIYIAKPIK